MCPPVSISLKTPYSPQYTGGGDDALVDGLRGATDFRLGAWQGYEGDDLEAVVDLGESKPVGNVAIGCLQDNNSWIFFPTVGGGVPLGGRQGFFAPGDRPERHPAE